MREPDEIFWERLACMPLAEAEQECVLRREGNSLELAMLQGEKNAIVERTGTRTTDAKAIGDAMAWIMAQNTRLNERIKYLRKLQDKLQWKHAVRALYGEEGVEQCVIWIQQTYDQLAKEA